MKANLPLPMIEYEITVSRACIEIHLNPGPCYGSFIKSFEAGDYDLAVAGVLSDVVNSLEEGWRKQSTI